MSQEKKIPSLNESVHIMIDIETLGMNYLLHPIVCLGAIRFNPFVEEVPPIESYLEMDYIKAQDVFFARFNIEQQNRDTEIDFDTLSWWMSKPEQAAMLSRWFAACKNDQPDHNYLRFIQFSEWIEMTTKDYPFIYLWAHGNTFDVPWVKFMFEAHKLKWPFSYKGLNETRTMISAYEFASGERFTWPEKIAAHHPLGDIVNQIKVVQKIVRTLSDQRLLSME